MRCINCQSELPQGAKFCFLCGAEAPAQMCCPHCRSEVPEGAKFCIQCGMEVALMNADADGKDVDTLEMLAVGSVEENAPDTPADDNAQDVLDDKDAAAPVAVNAAPAPRVVSVNDPTRLYGIRPVHPQAIQDLPQTLAGNIYILPSAKSFLNELVTGSRTEPAASLIAAVEAAYNQSRAENRFLIKTAKNSETNYIFLLPRDASDAPCDITCHIERNMHAINTSEQYVIKRFNEASPTECYPRLEAFAFVGNTIYPNSPNNLYYQLADKAMSDGESWKLNDQRQFDGQKPYNSLRNYMQYTFLRLAQTNKVLFSEQQDFAAFNTGLVDSFYHPLYACFVRNEREAATGMSWKFDCISAAEHYDALRNKLPHLPQRATYISKLDDILFDTKEAGEVRLSSVHILRDNIDRLPMNYLRRYLTDAALVTMLDDIEAAAPNDRPNLYKALREELKRSEHSYCLRDMYNRFQSAVKQAELRAAWNYKTAVPCYFPTTGQLSLMLPLCLTNDRDADVALVVEREGEEDYIGRTILTLEMAYLDARLICRPESDWLRADSIL